MKLTIRLRPVPTEGEAFYVEPDELREAADNCLKDIRKSLLSRIGECLASPGQLIELEGALHNEVGRCLDLFVARLIQAAHFDDKVLSRAAQLVGLRPHLRIQDRKQLVHITLLGGSAVTVTSPYLLNRPKKKRGRPKQNKTRGKNGQGLYPVLAILGIRERVTPAVASEVARQMALGTVSQTQENLAVRGIEIGRKKLHSIALSVGNRGLEFRQKVIEPSSSGELSLIQEKTILIGTDGGRLRTRVRKKGRRKKKSRHHGFEGKWREPKVLVVSELNEKGRRAAKGYQRYDATLGDCNRAFEILAGHLRMIGANQAARWVVVGDGAGWIWGRIPQLCAEVGFPLNKVIQIVDIYHAKQRLHAFADNVKSWSKSERNRWLKQAKKLLRAGEIEELHALCGKHFKGCNSKERRVLAEYFWTHKERMRYERFYQAKLPLGSGAVESCVRRLVNLRLKGNGIFWTEGNAEAVLQLRAQLLSRRWSEFIAEVLEPIDFWETPDTAQTQEPQGLAAA